jgi:hypothetical protein
MKREAKQFVGLGAQEIERLALPWDKCKYWLSQKQRFCRLQKISGGHSFCGEHLPQNALILVGDRELERVDCPLDPSQWVRNTFEIFEIFYLFLNFYFCSTCFLHLVDKHVAKCKKRKEEVSSNKECTKLDVNLRPSQEEEEKEIVPNIWADVLQDLNLAELSDSEYGDLLCRIIKIHECMYVYQQQYVNDLSFF